METGQVRGQLDRMLRALILHWRSDSSRVLHFVIDRALDGRRACAVHSVKHLAGPMIRRTFRHLYRLRCFLIFMTLYGTASSQIISPPRIWNGKDLREWATPVNTLNIRPAHYSEVGLRSYGHKPFFPCGYDRLSLTSR